MTFAADLGADEDLFVGARSDRRHSADRQEERVPDHFFFTSGSVTVTTWLTLTLSTVDVRPLGQRTSIRSTFWFFPTPKWGTRIALAEVSGARADVADLGRAPGFHADPGADAIAVAGRSDRSHHDPGCPGCRRRCDTDGRGPLRLSTSRSRSPSPSKSPAADPRPTALSLNAGPLAAETSTKRPSALAAEERVFLGLEVVGRHR